MASRTTPRQTADERREAVLEAAWIEFAQRGLHAASTDVIARRAGISQPYLFRLFGSKKDLFLAVNDMCFQRTLDMFRAAAAGKSGRKRSTPSARLTSSSSRAIPPCSRASCRPTSASVADEDIRASTARGYGRLVDYVETVSGADRATVARFFAKGMLINVLAAMDYSLEDEPPDSWAARLAEGCKED